MTTDKITIEFTPQQLAVIDQALQGLPFRAAAPVLAEIAKQILETAHSVSRDASQDG